MKDESERDRRTIPWGDTINQDIRCHNYIWLRSARWASRSHQYSRRTLPNFWASRQNFKAHLAKKYFGWIPAIRWPSLARSFDSHLLPSPLILTRPFPCTSSCARVSTLYPHFHKFPYGIYFSLRISMRLFQNYLNEVLGKNLIENQEPHQELLTSFLLRFSMRKKSSLRMSMRISMRSCPRSWFLMRFLMRFLILNKVFNEVLDSQWGSCPRPHWDLDFGTISLRFSMRKKFRKGWCNIIIPDAALLDDYSSSLWCFASHRHIVINGIYHLFKSCRLQQIWNLGTMSGKYIGQLMSVYIISHIIIYPLNCLLIIIII